MSKNTQTPIVFTAKALDAYQTAMATVIKNEKAKGRTTSLAEARDTVNVSWLKNVPRFTEKLGQQLYNTILENPERITILREMCGPELAFPPATGPTTPTGIILSHPGKQLEFLQVLVEAMDHPSTARGVLSGKFGVEIIDVATCVKEVVNQVFNEQVRDVSEKRLGRWDLTVLTPIEMKEKLRRIGERFTLPLSEHLVYQHGCLHPKDFPWFTMVGENIQELAPAPEEIAVRDRLVGEISLAKHGTKVSGMETSLNGAGPDGSVTGTRGVHPAQAIRNVHGCGKPSKKPKGLAL